MKQHLSLAALGRQLEHLDGDLTALSRKHIAIVGRHTVHIDGELKGVYENLVPTEGLIYLLRSGVLGQSQITNWFVALFSGNVNPVANWTAANFAANASEIVSSTEGYSETTRAVWTPNTTSPTAPSVSNSNSLATFSVVCTTNINISGSAILSSNIKGGTSGILLSAVRYPTPHTVNNGSTFQVGYTIDFQDI